MAGAADNAQDALAVELRLLTGCGHEAERCRAVASSLDGLRLVVPEANHPDMYLTIQEMQKCGRFLDGLAQESAIYQDRVPIVLDHLNVVLPSLSKSLRAIQNYWDDMSKSLVQRWRCIYHNLSREAGISLPARFSLYKSYLISLRLLLINSQDFDFNLLEADRARIMVVREASGIPAPSAPVGELVRAMALEVTEATPSSHWARRIFSLPLSSRTALTGQNRSWALGPFNPYGPFRAPRGWRILFRRAFDERQVTALFYIDAQDDCPYIVLRSYDGHHSHPRYSNKGVHELCILRIGSGLRLDRWSKSEDRSIPWAMMFFLTWEELVLTHCAFVALKCRSIRTSNVSPKEFGLAREECLFQARIDDDGFTHSLLLLRDIETQGLRLQASVFDDELRKCPIWTAFGEFALFAAFFSQGAKGTNADKLMRFLEPVTHQATSPTWLRRTGRRKFCLVDIHLYVFCDQYQQQNQRRGAAGEFEIKFMSEEPARAFERAFRSL